LTCKEAWEEVILHIGEILLKIHDIKDILPPPTPQQVAQNPKNLHPSTITPPRRKHMFLTITPRVKNEY